MKYDPSFSWKSDLPPAFTGVVGAVIAMLVLIICWMIALTLRAMPTVARLNKRQVFLLSINTGMLVITILAIAAGFFQPLPRLGAMFLITISIYNLYIYLLQILFVPTKEAVEAQFRAVELEGQIAQLRFEEEDDLSKLENRV
jgi:Ca2+/Na+ antiporter